MQLFCFLNCFKKRKSKDELLYENVYLKNHKKVLKLLKKGANPNAVIGYNVPLDLAIHNQDLIMIKILMYHGAIFEKEESKMFCYDCRKNHKHISTMYDYYMNILEKYMDHVVKENNIPYGVDNHLKGFLVKN